MIRRLSAALLALFLLLVPTAALAAAEVDEGADVTVVAADADGSEDEGHEGEDEGHELVNMDNGDPGDAGAQALADAESSGFVVVMMLGAGVVVVGLLVAGLVLGRGRNA